MKKEPTFYFNEITEHVYQTIQKMNRESGKVYEFTHKNPDRFSYQSIERKTNVCYRLNEQESHFFLHLVPNMRAAASITVKRSDESEFYVLFFQTEENEYRFEIDLDEEEEEMNGGVEAALGIRLDPTQWLFSDLKRVSLAEDEKHRLRIFTQAFQEWVADLPRYRLRFVTGESSYNTRELDRYLRVSR